MAFLTPGYGLDCLAPYLYRTLGCHKQRLKHALSMRFCISGKRLGYDSLISASVFARLALAIAVARNTVTRYFARARFVAAQLACGDQDHTHGRPICWPAGVQGISAPA